MFYHIKNLQSTKTATKRNNAAGRFYHIKNLQSTKTTESGFVIYASFITLRIYKVLKPRKSLENFTAVLSH